MLIAIEGLDASGKATQTKILADRMRAALISFPVYATPIGQAIATNLKGHWEVSSECSGYELDEDQEKRVNALVLQALMTINRLEMLPAIDQYKRMGTPVVLDRYWASGMVYGVADGLDPVWLRMIHASFPEPDAWIYLDVSVEESVRRRPERRDRYERDGLMAKRRQLYKELWSEAGLDRRWQVVNGDGTIDEVAGRIRDAIAMAGVLT